MQRQPLSRRWPSIVAALLFPLVLARLEAAQNVYLELSLNGQEVVGSPLVPTVGGVDVSEMIECIAFEWEALADEGGGRTSGRTAIRGLKFVHRLEDCSPLLLQALAQNERADGRFLFFRADTATGETVHFYTIEFEQGRVGQVRDWVPNTLDPAAASFPPMEEIQILSPTITVTAEETGTSFVVDLSASAA